MPTFDSRGITDVIQHLREPIHVMKDMETGGIGVALGDKPLQKMGSSPKRISWLATLPALYPEWLGDRSFQEVHRVRFPYIVGEMAGGIATSTMVIHAAKAGLLGFFGAAGLPLSRIEEAIISIQKELQSEGYSYGINLIHHPQDPEMEEKIVDLLLKYEVTRVSTSAFMKLTPAIVRYACSGLSLDAQGVVRRKNYIFAKLSRSEIARQFMSPAPKNMLAELLQQGKLTATEVELAARIPLAEDITVEGDSGGHTDNQPLTALFATIVGLRDQLSAAFQYERPIRLGAGGGLGTPHAIAASFGLGAAYVVTGSINQSSLEAGMSKRGKEMLAQAELNDFVMSPSSDMFELGVKVQVLKRGTLFHSKASQLYELYRKYPTLDAIPESIRLKVEKDIFKVTLAEIWESTKVFFETRDPREIIKAEKDEKHRMALVFRWYVGSASKWAIQGVQERQHDFQIWSGPAMGAFNAWVEGTCLAPLEHRTVAQIAYNLLEGAAYMTRAHQLRTYGVPVPAEAFTFVPRLFNS